MIEIRKMTIADLEQVEAIERDNFSEPWSFDAFKDAVEKDYTLYLVAMDGAVCMGYCGMYISGEDGEIPNVAVAKEFRRTGIAYFMMSVLHHFAYEKGVRKAVLEVRESNIPAIGLYERMGYKKIGIRKNFYRMPAENALIYELQIAGPEDRHCCGSECASCKEQGNCRK